MAAYMKLYDYIKYIVDDMTSYSYVYIYTIQHKT